MGNRGNSEKGHDYSDGDPKIPWKDPLGELEMVCTLKYIMEDGKGKGFVGGECGDGLNILPEVIKDMDARRGHRKS